MEHYIRNVRSWEWDETYHGFRAMARTILDEVLEVRTDQLAHVVKDPNGTAFNRTKYLPRRRMMMQQWADYLDTPKSGEEKIR